MTYSVENYAPDTVVITIALTVTILVTLLLSIFNPETPKVEVIISYPEVEAIYLPADYSGPIVAIPSDEKIFPNQ